MTRFMHVSGRPNLSSQKWDDLRLRATLEIGDRPRCPRRGFPAMALRDALNEATIALPSEFVERRCRECRRTWARTDGTREGIDP